MLENEVDESKLGELELERQYDFKGQTIRIRKPMSELVSGKRAKRWTCEECGWNATYAYAKIHDSSRGGVCESVAVKRNYRPRSVRSTHFIHKNF